MAAVRGVFTLNRVRLKKFVNEWTDLSQVWIDQIPNTGYFGGGRISDPILVPLSTMDKVTYSNDTTVATPSANLSVARYSLAATGNSTAGYFGGGLTPGPSYYSTMDKVTYSNDTTVAVPGANLSLARDRLAATGNSTAGYFGGGFSPIVSTMDKVTYSTDTTAAVPGAALSAARYFLAATGNSTAGYFGGGLFPSLFGNPGPISTIDKITYSTDTTASIIATSTRTSYAATGNSTAGYFGGGILSDNFGNPISTMDKVTYSTETLTQLPISANLSFARRHLAATGNSTHGYFGGGGDNQISSIDKTTYSLDTTALVPGANLSVARHVFAASSAKANALPQNLWRRFSDGSTTTNPASLPPATPTPQTIQVPVPNTGYFCGGFYTNSPSPFQSSGGEKINYPTDTITSLPTFTLSIARYDLAGTGNSTHGYFGGGGIFPSPTVFSIMDKLTYSNDTRITLPSSGSLSSNRRYLSATGNSTAGYFGAGFGFSTTDKITYSSDVRVATPSANLITPRDRYGATGSSTAGYFGGGNTFTLPFNIVSTMDKLTYSTDITATVPGAALRVARSELAATGNSTAGYFGGGRGGPTESTMDKLTYSTDTTASLPTAGFLSNARYRLAATGNSTAGYFVGGISPRQSTVDKITYASDTTSALPGSPLSAASYAHGAASARANALSETVPVPVVV